MKTIRTNCFETNSSSTHTFTIVSKKDLKTDGRGILVKNGVLDPGELQNTSAFHKLEYADGGFSVQAKTFEEKAALTLLHLSNLDCDEDSTKSLLIEYTKDLIVNSNRRITSVNYNRNSYYGFYCYDDEDGTRTYIQQIEEQDESDTLAMKEIIKNHFAEVVLDNDKTMIEEDTPY